MGKIVNINENDLKRIVKRVLNERQQLNEEKILNEGAYSDVESLFNKCKAEDHGKPKQTNSEHKRIAIEIRQAITHKTWIGTPATDEDKLVSALMGQSIDGLFTLEPCPVVSAPGEEETKAETSSETKSEIKEGFLGERKWESYLVVFLLLIVGYLIYKNK